MRFPCTLCTLASMLGTHDGTSCTFRPGEAGADMRLRRIEIAGFKSFADPTTVMLGPGITAIVGPNGCGKSNIVDAIRWVLGEHSARQLRGGVMEDLIFQGSETRPPAAYCEVELVLDPGNTGFPPPYEALAELRIARRLARDGRGEVRINGKLARVRDVADIFLNTGASARAYAVLEQGMVAKLVTARPQERRAFLEEAAGVARYRARKHEAEQKLAQVREQLARIRDLHAEVKSRLRSLKQQAARAERFRTMQQELESLQACIAKSEMDAAEHREQEVKFALAQAERELEAARTRLVQAERRREAQAQAMEAAERARVNMEEQLRALERKRAELHRAIERHAAEVRLAEERLAHLAREHARTQEELTRKEKARKEKEQALAEMDPERAQKALACARTTRENLEARLQALRKERDACFAAWQAHKAQREALVRRRRELAGRLDEVRLRKQELARRMREEEARRAKAERAYQEAKAVQEAAEKQLASLSAEDKRLRRQAEEAEDALRQARARVVERETAFREMKAEYEHAQLAARPAPDARSWLAHAEGAGGKPLLALSPPEGLEAAVAAAVGREVAAAWRERPASWETIVDEAKALGAAAFLRPLETESPPRVNGAMTLAEALGLAEEDPWHAPFARVLLVEDARAVEATTGFICVDRAGRRRDPHGGVVAVASEALARRLQAARKAKALVPRLRRLQEELAEAREELAACSRRVEEMEARLRAHTRTLGKAERSLHAAEGECARAHHALAAASERIAHLGEEAKRLAGAEAQLVQELSDTEDASDARETESRAKLQAVEQEIAALEAQLRRAREKEREAERVHIAELARARAWHAELQGLAREVKTADSRLEAIRREMRKAEAELARLQQASPDRQALLALDARAENMQQKLHALRAEHAQARKALAEADEAVRDAQKTLVQAEARVHAQQSELVDARRRLAEARQRAQQFADVEAAVLSLAEARARAAELEARIQSFGAVNLLAIEECAQTEARERFLRAQMEDLEQSAASLEGTMRRTDREVRRRFAEVFEEVNARFEALFPRMFGGGRARLVLTNEDPLSAGVAVAAEPPGKRLQDIGLLSGGEKALTALVLLFALFEVRPAPFCVLDEVDAPLDDENVARFVGIVREHAEEVQFLTITHNKITMQHADRLIGVSMPEAGVTRIVSVDWNEQEA